MTISIVRDAKRLCVCLLAGTGVSACADADLDPTSVVVAEDTGRALLTGVALQDVPVLVGEADLGDELGGAVLLWEASWELGRANGWELREAAYEEIAGPLSEVFGEGEESRLEAIVGAVGLAVEAAELVATDRLGERVLDQLGHAGTAYRGALTDLEAGRSAQALVKALRSADLLREAGPEGVGRHLLAMAETRLDELGVASASLVASGMDPEDVERGEHLLRGARIAMHEGDYARAIQRAYYACQLLGISPR